MTAASQLSDLADFGSGATGGATATLQDSNIEVKSKLLETAVIKLFMERCVKFATIQISLQASKPSMGADSLEDLVQQQKSPVAKNDSFERIGSDEGKFLLCLIDQI